MRGFFLFEKRGKFVLPKRGAWKIFCYLVYKDTGKLIVSRRKELKKATD